MGRALRAWYRRRRHRRGRRLSVRLACAHAQDIPSGRFLGRFGGARSEPPRHSFPEVPRLPQPRAAAAGMQTIVMRAV